MWAPWPRKAEALGFESFWCAEHPFIPVHTKSRFPSSPDGVIPESYSHFVDPFVALARASGATTRIKLGTGIVLVPERHPLVLAKEVSTLDHFSGGRFLFGIGAGWLREETEIMGGDFDHRWTQTRESVLAMKELLDQAGGGVPREVLRLPAGPLVSEARAEAASAGDPGRRAPNVFKRIVEWGDGWLPTCVGPDVVREAARRSIASPRRRAATPPPSRSRCTGSPRIATSSAGTSTRAPRAWSSARPP